MKEAGDVVATSLDESRLISDGFYQNTQSIFEAMSGQENIMTNVHEEALYLSASAQHLQALIERFQSAEPA